MPYTPTLETGDTHLVDLGDGLDPAERILRLWEPYATTGSKPAGVAKGVVAHARIDDGRWIVDCPFNCGNAQLPSHVDRRFFCILCENAPVSGKWVMVQWPEDDAIEAAEILMSNRPRRGKWWNPEIETVGDLATENDFQGFNSDLPARLETRITRPPIVRGVIFGNDPDHDPAPGAVDPGLADRIIAGTAHLGPVPAPVETFEQRVERFAEAADLVARTARPAARAAALNRVTRAKAEG